MAATLEADPACAADFLCGDLRAGITFFIQSSLTISGGAPSSAFSVYAIQSCHVFIFHQFIQFAQHTEDIHRDAGCALFLKVFGGCSSASSY